MALGNDQDSDKYDTAFEEWEPNLFSKLECKEPKQQLQKSRYHTAMVANMDYKTLPNYIAELCSNVSLTTNKKLCVEDYERDFRHYEFNIKETNLTFDIGDSFGISPRNNNEDMERILSMYNLNIYDVININDSDLTTNSSIYPKLITAYDLFGCCLDILGKPKSFN